MQIVLSVENGERGIIVAGRLSELFSRVAEKVDRSVGWWRLSTPLAVPVLIGLRDRLRADNLYDTGRGPRDRPPYEDPHVVNHSTARTLNGTYNDLDDPLMGSLGSRYGRNVPLNYTNREEDKRLLDPSPRLISRRLLARPDGGFQPATTLNLLAAAWIQFEVHDWFSHGTDYRQRPWEIPLEKDDPWPDEIMQGEPAEPNRTMEIKRTAPDPSPDPQAPPTYVTQDTHWWDGSQIYGRDPKYAYDWISRSVRAAVPVWSEPLFRWSVSHHAGEG